VPTAVREALAAQLAPYRAAHPDVRWTRPETWHLTLLFLGAVVLDHVVELERLVEGVAGATASYDVSLDRGDGRIRGREGMAWLALSEGAGRLIETAELVARECPADITAGPAPKRTPSAHLTVVRKAHREALEALREQRHGPLSVAWTVDAIQLVRSHLEPGGARYVTLLQVPL
jgi:2'-5' RNA ligase